MSTITSKDGTLTCCEDWGKIVENAKLVVYPGAPRGLTETHKGESGNRKAQRK
jgi:hypothetical protein